MTLIPCYALAIPPVLSIKDPEQQVEKCVTLMCHLAKVVHNFWNTPEGKTNFIWIAHLGLLKGASALGFVAVPVLGNGALFISMVCNGTYAVYTLRSPKAIGNIEFLSTVLFLVLI